MFFPKPCVQVMLKKTTRKGHIYLCKNIYMYIYHGNQKPSFLRVATRGVKPSCFMFPKVDIAGVQVDQTLPIGTTVDGRNPAWTSLMFI